MKGIKNENDGNNSLHGIRRNGIRRNGKTPIRLTHWISWACSHRTRCIESRCGAARHRSATRRTATHLVYTDQTGVIDNCLSGHTGGGEQKLLQR